MTHRSGRDSHERPASILFLDLEGGWGGSSRSLYYLVESIDRKRWLPFVILRKTGPASRAYDELGVPYEIIEELPSFRPAERKNILAFLIFVWRARRVPMIARRIRSLHEERNFALFHVNHESLGLFAAMLSRLIGLEWSSHIRTQLKPGFFARRVYSLIDQRARKVAFISEPVRDHFLSLTRRRPDTSRHRVVYNIAKPPSMDVPAPDVMKDDAQLRVISLSNFSPNRGVDRILDVAQVLADRGEGGIRFYLFGKPANTTLTGQVNPYYKSMLTACSRSGLEDYVLFPGHLSPPDGAIRTGDVLIKLTREANPWGRDIIEAMRGGLAIVSLGSYDRFVGQSGGLVSEVYDPAKIADFLLKCRDEPEFLRNISAANRKRSAALFGAEHIGATMNGFFEEIISSQA